MKFKAILLFLAGLAFFAGCRQPRPALIPEISTPLVQEEVCSWEGRLAGDAIFPCANGIGWVDAAGRIMACDIEKKTVAAIYTVPFAVTVPPFLQGDLLVLRDKAADRLLIYDLAARAVAFEALRLGATHVLGVDADCLVYLDGEGLVVNFWRSPGVVFRTPTGEAAQFFNCRFTPERVLILEAGLLYTFWKKSGRFGYEQLPQQVISPFYFDGEHIYYGSGESYLVKYSTAKKRLSWKLKLGQLLSRTPQAFAGTIVASPADNNVMQVNARGSILWWQALRSTMSFDLLVMDENLAAVLLNREIRFIEPRRGQVTVFPGMARPYGPPLALRRDLYFMTHDGGQTYRLLRVGNRYGVDVELEPSPRWVGQSLRFSVQPQNLLAPRWECVILDAQGRPVFSRSMTGAEKVSLVWVPLLAGQYLVRVRAQGLNRDARVEVPVRVLDPLRVAPGFFLHF